MTSSWKSLEEKVRIIASLRWMATCNPMHLDGVDFDGVCQISPEEIVIIETTQQKSLEKVRDDINKISPTKMRLAASGVFCRGFIVLGEEPTASMVEAGERSKINVCSFETFANDYFNFSSYKRLRDDLPFGSAVDSKTGQNDNRPYIGVQYKGGGEAGRYSLEEVAELLRKGKKIVLTGDYGAGKSRGIKELFSILATGAKNSTQYPLAINLRDHWSSSSALEILAGHMGNVGYSKEIDNVVRMLNTGSLLLLLDGFDEIGTQVHDTRIEDRRALRKRAVKGVRDLILKNKGGLLITGRSHYFDSSEEMLESLGFFQFDDCLALELPDNFSESEGRDYLRSLNINVSIPDWLPRKPLVFQLLAELDLADSIDLLSKPNARLEFWPAFIYSICRRESKGVGGSIAPQTIQLILKSLASKTRYSNSFCGRLTATDIDSAYQMIVGSVPDQSGRQLLSRMCALGRIEPESPDRQFVDANLVDVLRADGLVNDVISMNESSGLEQWVQSLTGYGILHAANSVVVFDLDQMCFSYLKKFGNSRNTKRLGEIVSILTAASSDALDFNSLQLVNSCLPLVDLKGRVITNLVVKKSEVNDLFLEGTAVRQDHALQFEECLFGKIYGISAHSGLPNWITQSDVIEFELVSNSARIKESQLSASQKLFLSMIHKIFFQSGSGRQESSLLKGGFGQKYSPKLADQIIKILMRNGTVNRLKGDDGWVYKPVRGHMDRMNKIKSELTLSEDEIWKEVSRLSPGEAN